MVSEWRVLIGSLISAVEKMEEMGRSVLQKKKVTDLDDKVKVYIMISHVIETDHIDLSLNNTLEYRPICVAISEDPNLFPCFCLP